MSNSSDVKNLSSFLDFVIMQRKEENKSDNSVAQLESVIRLSNIPIVETGWNYAGQMYTRIKNSNPLVQWTLGTAEMSLNSALPPAVAIFTGPIYIIDKLLCKSLDIMEQRVPSIYLPPQMMYWETKQYVSSKFVRPVLKRADSVREIGNSVLASKYTTYAADTLDSALNVADKYVDIYLPDAADQALDEADSKKVAEIDDSAGKAVQTIHHVDRFSRKLQRRLTRRTLAEAKALKERSAESIHVLLYVAELVSTDPKLALDRARELWSSLSENEPENQARPTTLEQLIVMLTRESARRVVHLVNFTKTAVSNLPHTISKGVHLTTAQCVKILDNLVKTIHMEGVKNATVAGAKVRARRMSMIVQQLNSFTTVLLERLALAVAGHPEPRKPVKSAKYRNNHHHQPAQNPAVQAQPVHSQAHAQQPRSQFRSAISHRNSNSGINNGAQS